MAERKKYGRLQLLSEITGRKKTFLSIGLGKSDKAAQRRSIDYSENSLKVLNYISERLDEELEKVVDTIKKEYKMLRELKK